MRLGALISKSSKAEYIWMENVSMPKTDSTPQQRCRGQNGEAWKEKPGAAAERCGGAGAECTARRL